MFPEIKVRLSRERLWAIDPTSYSTYAKLKNAKFGNNKQVELMPQLNVMMVTDAQTCRPLFSQIYNGSIPDMVSCTATFESLLNLDVHSFVAVAERGFFSKDKLKMIVAKGYHFVMCVPEGRRTSFQKYVDEAMTAFSSDLKYDLVSGQNIYTCKEKVQITDEVSAYVQVFFDAATAGEQMFLYQRRIAEVKRDYEAKQQLTAEGLAFLADNFDKDGNGALTLKKRHYRQAINNCGVFMVFSDNIKHSQVAFKAYRQRDSVESNFATLKTRMKIRRLRVNSEETLTGKCFVQFLALTLYTLIDKVIARTKENGRSLPHHSVRTILDELSVAGEYYFPENNSYVTAPISKKAKECFSLFRVLPPESHYETGLATVNERKKAKKPHGDDLKSVLGKILNTTALSLRE